MALASGTKLGPYEILRRSALAGSSLLPSPGPARSGRSRRTEGREQNSLQPGAFEVKESHVLFDAGNISPNIASSQYDVTGDGQRFIVITTGDQGALPLTVVQNWTVELKKK